MSHMDQQAVPGQPAVSQSPIIIFENEQKKETTEAEERLGKQGEAQRKIEEELKRRQEETRNKPQHQPT